MLPKAEYRAHCAQAAVLFILTSWHDKRCNLREGPQLASSRVGRAITTGVGASAWACLSRAMEAAGFTRIHSQEVHHHRRLSAPRTPNAIMQERLTTSTQV